MGKKDKTLARLEMEMSVQTWLDNSDLLLASQVASAKAVYNYYNELQKAGFSQQEALRIVEVHGLMPPVGKPEEG